MNRRLCNYSIGPRGLEKAALYKLVNVAHILTDRFTLMMSQRRLLAGRIQIEFKHFADYRRRIIASVVLFCTQSPPAY